MCTIIVIFVFCFCSVSGGGSVCVCVCVCVCDVVIYLDCMWLDFSLDLAPKFLLFLHSNNILPFRRLSVNSIFVLLAQSPADFHPPC